MVPSTSQSPTTSAPGNPVSSSGFYGHLYACTYTDLPIYTHAHKRKKIFLKDFKNNVDTEFSTVSMPIENTLVALLFIILNKYSVLWIEVFITWQPQQQSFVLI